MFPVPVLCLVVVFEIILPGILHLINLNLILNLHLMNSKRLIYFCQLAPFDLCFWDSKTWNKVLRDGIPYSQG